MKLTALCCTFRRPHSLGELIESFLRQDYPRELRELIILDDSGQYEHQQGDGWQLVSIPRRFRSLGEKRNACAALASPDAEGFLVADDDDIYLSHWFRTQAQALQRADWSRPGLVLLEDGDGLREVDSEGLYHGGWPIVRFGHFGGTRPMTSWRRFVDHEIREQVKSKYGAVATSGLSTENDGVKAVAQALGYSADELRRSLLARTSS